MEKEEIAYCGLNCKRCQESFADIREKIRQLDVAFEKVNISEMVKAIPLMNFKYNGYKKLSNFFNQECPGCRNQGGNPFCGIRKCAVKRGYFTCTECDDLCKRFNALFKIHNDGEIQTNIQQIKEMGIDVFVEQKS